MIGAGTYASNQTCAVSATGDGEYNIRFVAAFHVAAILEYKQLPLQEACDYLVFEKAGDIEGDMGLIAVNANGEVAMSFNAERMHRGCRSNTGEGYTRIY